MNKFKSILLGLVLSLSFAQAYNNGPEVSLPVAYQAEPPAPFSLAGHYSFARKEWSAVAIKGFDTLWSDLGGRKGFNIELFGLVGGNGASAIVGGGIGLVIPLHERISVGFGLTLSKSGNSTESFFSNLKDIEFGGTASVTYQVRF